MFHKLEGDAASAERERKRILEIVVQHCRGGGKARGSTRLHESLRVATTGRFYPQGRGADTYATDHTLSTGWKVQYGSDRC